MRLKITVLVVLVSAPLLLGVLGYAGLGSVGVVAPPPGVPRANADFATITWTESHYASSAAFRTITVHPDGRFTERFSDGSEPDRDGTLTPDQLATVEELATSRQLAAERRWHATFGGPDCTDSSTITVTMRDFGFSVLNCGNLKARKLPTFAQLSSSFRKIASPVRPPGGA
ncbi:MAG: hypothetical protein ACRDT6_17650 [Micromonosporaceae bacterium]